MAELSEAGRVTPPVFSEPWHAQLFAVTVRLNETGRLNWSDWAAAFGATLKRHGLDKDLDGGDDYFLAWLETLETILLDAGVVTRQETQRVKSSWTRAYLDTPHGMPVSLGD